MLPSGLRSRVAAVETADGPLDVAVQGMSVVVRLEDDLDVPRGEMLADPHDQPVAARTLEATVCWMSERPVQAGARLGIKHTTRWARAILDAVESKLDVETLDAGAGATGCELNDIGRVRLRLSGPLLVDPYAVNRTTGAFVLVDEATNDTVAAGMVVAAHALSRTRSSRALEPAASSLGGAERTATPSRPSHAARATGFGADVGGTSVPNERSTCTACSRETPACAGRRQRRDARRA